MIFGPRIFRVHGNSIRKQESALLKARYKFQTKYTALVLTAVIGGFLLFMLPAYFLTHQNFNVLKMAALEVRPEYAEHLDRESQWITAVLFLSLAAMGAFATLITVRMTRHMMDSVGKVDRHIRLLTLGKWNTPEPSPPQDDELMEFATSYNYFIRSIVANTEVELDLLKRIQIDPKNRESYAAWKELVDLKAARLGLNSERIIAPGESTNESEDQSRAA